MYTIAIAEASSEVAAAYYMARQVLFDVIEQLDAVAAAFYDLAGDTEWSSKGVAALNTRICEFSEQAQAERAHVQTQLWALERSVIW